jgi:hypothetical protein
VPLTDLFLQELLPGLPRHTSSSLQMRETIVDDLTTCLKNVEKLSLGWKHNKAFCGFVAKGGLGGGRRAENVV